MDFSYYNKDNELIKFNLQVGTKWDDLNIKNDSLNSIFSKVDNGDREITDQDELNILEKLLKKADGILDTTSKNNILENEELEEIEKQIEEGKITLPKRKNNSTDRVSKETVTHSEGFTKEEVQAIRNNETDIETIRQKYMEKIKADLKKYHHYDDRFPEDRYEIDVKYNGRYYESFVYDKESKTMFQNINIIRNDGIELEFGDNFDGNIDNDSKDIIIYDKEPVFKIVDNTGKTHVIRTLINDGEYTIQDLRLQEKAIAEFFAQLPKETIQEIIDKNVSFITFSAEPDEEFANLYKLDEKGNCIYIYEDELPNGERDAEIISPLFIPPKRVKKQTNEDSQFKLDGNYKANIEKLSGTSSILQIETPTGKIHKIAIQTDNTEEYLYNNSLLPRFLNILKELPENIIADLINEIDNITLNKNDMLGYYNKDSKSFVMSLYDEIGIQKLHPKITLIHELGHALDNNGNGFWSENPVFTEKFNSFAKLARIFEKKYLIETNLTTEEKYEMSHALENPQEFFAAVVADTGVNYADIDGNYISKLDKIFLPFKNSDNKDELICYKLYIELKNEVKEALEKIRFENSKNI